jgi:hypothetical protein
VEYVFPPSAKVIDVTQPPYSADRTGKTDVSAILSKAANDDINISGWCPRILYMPNGTYLVKNTFAWKLAGSGNGNGPVVMGQSRTGTVIKLAKGTWPLGTELKGVIQTGAGVEQNFNKSIRNLTVLVDSNNAGAIGIVYVSNNVGMISDVNVISADGKGAYGIQACGGVSGVGGNGPFIIRRTFIKGFQVGIRAGGTQGEMVSQIRLEGQGKFGIWVSGNNLTIDSLISNDTCPALEAQAPVMLTHGLLLGGSPRTYGIRNWVNSSFFSDIVTSGYKAAITSMGANPAPTGPSFVQHTPVVPVSLFSDRKTSMNLPSKYPPEVPWESDFSKWASIDEYKTNGRNDAQAFQAAIDDPTKTTVCLPNKVVRSLSQPVYVRGTISRIIGTGTVWSTVSKTSSQIIIDDGSAPAVILQNMGNTNFSDLQNFAQIIKKTNRTAILETIEDGFDVQITGGGETYITDVSLGHFVFDNPRAKVYLWQFEGSNAMDDSTFIIRNGMVRMAGYYHEANGTSIICDGGFTEILGYWAYATMCNNSGRYLLVVRNNANVSAAGVWQQNFCNPWSGYDGLVLETRNQTTKTLNASSGAGKITSPAGSNIALFTAYDSAQLQSGANVHSTPVMERRNSYVSATTKPAGIEIIYQTALPGPAVLIVHDVMGRIVSVVNSQSMPAGVHRTLIPRTAGVVCIQIRTCEGTFNRRIVAHEKW